MFDLTYDINSKRIAEQLALNVQEYIGQLKKHHPASYDHLIRTCAIGAYINRWLKVPLLETLDRIYFDYASLLHDCGKIRIPVKILERNGNLNSKETKIAREHVTYSIEMLRYFKYPEVMKIVAVHHEFKKKPYRRSVTRRVDIERRATDQNHMRSGELLVIADTIDRITNPLIPGKPKPNSKQELIEDIMSDFTGSRILVEQVAEIYF